MQNNEDDLVSLDNLCTRFSQSIIHRDFDQSREIIEMTKNNYPRDIQVHIHQKMILLYYLNKSRSIMLFDNLYLYRGFQGSSHQGFFYSDPLNYTSKKRLNINLPPPWKCLNPSIINLGNKYLIKSREHYVAVHHLDCIVV